MRFLILLVLLAKEGEEGVGVPYYEEYLDEGDVLSCVNEIVKDHFDLEHEVTILTRGSKDYVKGIEGTVRLIGNISKLDKMSWFGSHSQGVQQVVVFLDGDSRRDLNVFISFGTFHLRSRFLIVLTIGDTSNLSIRNYLIKIVRHLHENRIRAIAIAVKSNDSNIQLYGYTKTAHGNCGNPEILSFGQCNSKKSVSRLFPTTVNYNQCPIRLVTFDWPPLTKFIIENGNLTTVGIESSLVHIIVDRLNASKSFIAVQPSMVRGIIGNYRGDIGYGQMALYGNNKALVNTKSYGSVQGLVLVPKYSSVASSALNNFMPLEITVWFAVILVLIFLIILRNVLPVFKAISMLEIFALLLSLSVKLRLERLSQRTYAMSLVLFGYIITQAYLANLMMIFTKANDQGGIRSLDELDKSKIPFGGSVTSAEIFREKYPRLYGQYKGMSLTQFKQNLENLKNGTASVAMYVEATKFVSYKHWEDTIIVPEKITWYPVAMLLPNSSTILATCDWVITAIFEAGLLDQWADSLDHQQLLITTTRSQVEDNSRMGLQRFLPIFLFLGMGLGLGTTVFIIEFLMGFCRKK